MTVEKLYAALATILKVDNSLSLQTSLTAIGSSLTNLVTQPALPQYQASLAQSLQSLERADAQLEGTFSSADRAVLHTLGGEEFFSSEMISSVRNTIATNAMTPSVANERVRKLISDRQEFLQTVKATHDGLHSLHFSGQTTKPGTAEITFVVPRNLFENDVAQFAKELEFFNRLVRVVTESLTGTIEPVRLDYLSSSTPTVALLAAIPVVAGLATIVEKFLAGWERIEKIRSLRAGIAEVGIQGDALKQLTESIDTTIEEIVEESTTVTLIAYTGDGTRRNELETGLRQEIKRLFGQIERGLLLEFKASQPEEGKTVSAKTAKELEGIQRVARSLEYPTPASTPLLLDKSEVIEGEITVRTKQVKKSAGRSVPKKADTQS